MTSTYVSNNATSSLTSVSVTPTPAPTSTESQSVLTTWPSTTYTVPLTSWGNTPNGFSDFNLGDKILQLVTSGSNGERIVRGFLMGVALGIILGGALCCWVPCFGRARQERRARRRQQREQAEQQAREQEQQQHVPRTGQEIATEPVEGQQGPPESQPNNNSNISNNNSNISNNNTPAMERSYVRLRWDRMRRRHR
ncbi:FAM176 family domain-containing protein [Pochonia chlamydosporia 170]|uniref:FAM176 family domain-containing protein n=1 Tax=Pochonia chlamydosporia 170 TaxID=1380566 RepID=A0A179FP18_METCM|nr:FAM176 family domain-containing protein [Pochonia chlamydosporia 170]OAQ66749.1 FAM176 family domain-containing protein [Pochonia chlamydosporia 170]